MERGPALPLISESSDVCGQVTGCRVAWLVALAAVEEEAISEAFPCDDSGAVDRAEENSEETACLLLSVSESGATDWEVQLSPCDVCGKVLPN